MLTRADRTISDALEVLDDVEGMGLLHIGFKDVGVSPGELNAINKRIQSMGAVSYMEVVSTSLEACLASARVAREIGVDRLLGGTAVDEVMAILDGSPVAYLPFPGKPFDHPTKLAGSPTDVQADCRRFSERGCAGVDLLAYRSTEADPIDMVKAARRGTSGVLLVAGAVCRPEQIKALAGAGADAFTVGSAVFDGSFAPQVGSLRSQIGAVLDAAR